MHTHTHLTLPSTLGTDGMQYTAKHSIAVGVLSSTCVRVRYVFVEGNVTPVTRNHWLLFIFFAAILQFINWDGA